MIEDDWYLIDRGGDIHTHIEMYISIHIHTYGYILFLAYSRDSLGIFIIMNPNYSC